MRDAVEHLKPHSTERDSSSLTREEIALAQLQAGVSEGFSMEWLLNCASAHDARAREQS